MKQCSETPDDFQSKNSNSKEGEPRQITDGLSGQHRAETLEELYRSEWKKVCRSVTRRIRGLSKENAENAAADAYEFVFKKWDKLTKSPKESLYSKAWSRGWDYWKYERRHSETSDECASQSPSAEDELQAREKAVLLKRAISRLNARERTFLEKRRQYTLKEIAVQWDHSHGYMRQYASRVYRKLRNTFEEFGVKNFTDLV